MTKSHPAAVAIGVVGFAILLVGLFVWDRGHALAYGGGGIIFVTGLIEAVRQARQRSR